MGKFSIKNLVSQVAAIILVIAQGIAIGGEQKMESTFPGQPPSGDFFQHGRYEAALTSGVLFSPFVVTKNRPTINYTMTELQFGYMLSDVKEAGWLRGNFELAGEGFGGAIFEGKGSYISGVTAWLRYNFVPQRLRLVPYVQAGAGLTFTDANRNVLGQTFNFNLDLGVGARYFVARNLSVGLEYRYQHTSNAHLARRDIGINAQGPILGVTYFFGTSNSP